MAVYLGLALAAVLQVGFMVDFGVGLEVDLEYFFGPNQNVNLR